MTAPSVPLAYLVNRYPAVSHTFIMREVAQLRVLGHVIHTASIHPPDRAPERMDGQERAEAQATYCVKAHGLWGAVLALAYWIVHAPLRLLCMLWQGQYMGVGLTGLAYGIEAAMVARWMARLGLAHLHVHFGNAGASVGVLVRALTHCHLSYTIHGPDEFDDVPGQRLARKMAAANAVVCISQFARSQLMRISSPDDWGKFSVCRLGVDPTQFMPTTAHAANGHLHLLCVGRLAPAKCQVLLVQACAHLRAAGVDFTLTLVGEGPDRARIEAAIAAHDLHEWVVLTGALTQEGVRLALAQSDIFVLPSLAEGIPVVLMEAMCCGVPCISTSVNGIPELIEHGQTGLLATPGDVDSLVEQMLRLCRNQAERECLAQAAYVKVRQRFDLQRNVQQLSQIFASFSV